MQETILWTVVPRRYDTATQRLHFAVRISPRLQGDQQLQSLSDFCFAQWAGTQLSFKACFGAGSSPIRLDAQIENDVRDPALWSAIFPCDTAHSGAPDTKVHSHVFDRDGHCARPVQSFPVMDVLAFVKGVYQRIAMEHPLAPPDVNALIPWGRDLNVASVLDAVWPLVRQQNLPVGDDVLHLLPPPCENGTGSHTDSLARLLNFHTPKNGDLATKPNFKTSFDFHETLSLVEDSDFLLRRLGLVLELSCALPPDFVNNFGGDNAGISVLASWPEPANTSPSPTQQAAPPVKVAPITMFRFSEAEGIFCAANNSTALKDGFLDLSQAGYDLMQVDVDGAAIKLVDYVRHLVNLQPERAGVERTELPALRSAGMALVHTGRAESFAGRAARAAELNGQISGQPELNGQISGQPVLYAEDLVRGLRLDVLADIQDGTWRSLCQREEAYSTRAPGTPGMLSEGELPALLKFSFKEYARINRESTLTSAPTQKPKDPDFFLHETLAHWEGWSLAVRRPGKKVPDPSQDVPKPLYLADGAPAPHDSTLNITLDLPKDGDGKALATLPRLRFGRAYRMRARAVDITGHSLALQAGDRSLHTATPDAVSYLRFEPIASPVLARIEKPVPGESMERVVIRSADDAASNTEQSIRVVCPPRISQQMAEQHGMFDQPPPSDTWYQLLTERHGDEGQLRGVVPPGSDAKADGMDILAAVPTDMPYLPDPLAPSTLVRVLGPDGVAEQTISFAHSQAWPHAAPFCIRLVKGSGLPAWDSGSRTLKIPVPAGRMRAVQLSSVPRNAADLDLLGIWGWVCSAASPERLDKLRPICASGKHWMLTPARTVTLVHAVKKPCRAPRIEALLAKRDVGQSFALLSGSVAIDGPSTGKLEMHATWTDRVDDVTQVGTGADYSALCASHAFDLVHGDMQSDRAGFLQQHHAFPDTKYHRVRYISRAVSRYQEYFENNTSGPFSLDSETSFELDILSSARPAAPQIEYIVPTFGWERSGPEGDVPVPAGDAAHSTLHFARKGGGLRVYLKRPWFSSGNGELLGVVIYAGPKGTDVLAGKPNLLKVPAGCKHVVTQWGYDPIWTSHPPDALPALAHFPEAVLRNAAYTLQELDSTTVVDVAAHAVLVDVAAHAVQFDAERQLWYCDITVDLGPAYFPFIRFALARMQPHSVLGAELSKVVQADFIQCAPDRTVTLTAVPDHPLMLRLSVAGPAPFKQKANLVPTMMAVRVEVLHTSADSEAWVPVQSGWQALPRSQVTPAATVWSGGVILPVARGSHRMRLVIGELEVLPADGAAFGAVMEFRALKTATGTRTVYSDVFEI